MSADPPRVDPVDLYGGLCDTVCIKALEFINLAQRVWPMDKMRVKKDESNLRR